MPLADGLDQVADVQRPVAVVAVELVPVDREVDLPLPLPEKGCLAVACVRGDDNRATVRAFSKPLEQARSPEGGGHVVRRGALVVYQRVDVLDIRHRVSRSRVTGLDNDGPRRTRPPRPRPLTARVPRAR